VLRYWPRMWGRLSCAVVTSAWLLSGTATAAHRQLAMLDYVQDIWEASEGTLPHPGVTVALQTRDHYLWIGTYAGLVRFDGLQFHTPDATAPAFADHIRCLLETDDGALWAGTRREGLVRLKADQVLVLTKKDGLGGNEVRGLAQTKDGTVWIATAAGVTARDPSGRLRTYTDKDGLPSNGIQTLYTDVDRTLWVGTQGFGIARWDGTRFRSTTLVVPPEAIAASELAASGLRNILSLARDAAGTLWAGTTVGLLRVPEEGRTVEPGLVLSAADIVVPSRRGGMWVGTNAGLFRIEADGSKRRYAVEDGLLHNAIMALYEDGEGSVWVGTRIGLARLRPRVIQTYTRRDGLPLDLMTSVLETSAGAVWAGSRSGASRLVDGVWTTLGVADGLPHQTVRALAEGPDGTLWVGTNNGVAGLRNGRFSTFRGEGAPYSVRALTVDAAGRVYLGTPGGVDVLEGERVRRVVPMSELCGQAALNVIHVSRSGVLWLGGGSALIRVEDGKVQCLADKEVLSRNDVRSFYEDAGGQLWIGSVGGLSRIVNGERQSFPGRPGPFNSAVYGILEDDGGSLWCSTPRGLFQIDKQKIDVSDKRALLSSYRAFGSADGMETPVGTGDGQPTAFRGRDGRLWFSSATGLAVVDPRRVEVSTMPPPVYVERLVADGMAVDLHGRRVLHAGTRGVEVDFNAVSFVAPESVQYRYELEGVDRDWVEGGGRRVAQYTNLAPGHYRFRVRAANHNGIWNEAGSTLEFDLEPHFYQTRWFLPLCVLILLSSATALYRYRIASLRAREAELQVRVDEAVAKVQVLSGLLPICASCRRVREDTGYWRQIEAYVQERSSAKFSHGVCPECWDKMREQEPGLPEYGKN
jgi:ligand-binding sensor domain-containing protein